MLWYFLVQNPTPKNTGTNIGTILLLKKRGLHIQEVRF